MPKDRENTETGLPERFCEDCAKWLGLYEFPNSHRTWVCKVCQGMKKPARQKLAPGVYQKYLADLATLDVEMRKLRLRHRDELQELSNKRQQVVSDYYAKVSP